MPDPWLSRKRTLLGNVAGRTYAALPDGCMAKGESHPHFYTVRPQIPLQIVDFYLLRGGKSARPASVHSRVIAEQFKGNPLLPAPPRGNDGHGTAGSHGVPAAQIKAILDAVVVDGVDDQLSAPFFDALLEPASASMPVFSRPPLANNINLPSTRLISAGAPRTGCRISAPQPG